MTVNIQFFPLLLLFVEVLFKIYADENQLSQSAPPVEKPHFGDKEDVYDEAHIKAHLEDKLELGEKKMSPEEERYHYFSMNDLNKDNVIDGIEVWKAIHHNHDHHGKLEGPPATPLSDEEVEKSVDDVMKDIDLNGDGAIDYSEYIKKVEL